MSFLALEAYVQLIRMDRRISHGDFQALYERVRKQRVRDRHVTESTIEQICLAIDTACTWHWKEIACLARSSATVCLLRRHGVQAMLLIGTQEMPFRAHAWVEVEGRVVNDRPYIREIYAVLDCC